MGSTDRHIQVQGSYFRIPQRYVLTFLTFSALLNAFAMRVNISIAITKMVRDPNLINSTPENNQTETIVRNRATPYINRCKHDSDIQSDENDKMDSIVVESFAAYSAHEEFEWSEQLQGIILSSFYYGYALSQIPGGFLVQKYGGKYVLAFGIFFSGLLSIAIPTCVQYGGAHSLIALQVLIGISQGPIISACLNLFSSWIPLTERCTIVSLAYAGITVGTIIGTFGSGALIHRFETWHSSFYVFGLGAIVWFFFFIFLCYSKPMLHPCIDATEKSYLDAEVNSQIGGQNCDHRIIPWRAMLSSGPVLALIFTQLTQDWGYFIYEIYLPKYLHNIFGVSTQKNGILSSIPHVAQLFLLFFVGLLSDWLTANNILSVTNMRKMFVAFSSLIAAAFTIAASYAERNQIVVITCFTIAVSSHSLSTSGTLVNALDLTAHYVGPLGSVVNGVGSFVAIIIPHLVGCLTPSAQIYEWRIVFWITFAVNIISLIVFCAFGSGKSQAWDHVDHRGAKDVCVMKSLSGCCKVFMFFVINTIFWLLITYI